MKYRPVRDLRTTPAKIWAELKQDDKLVLTNNGEPMALLIHVNGDSLSEKLAAYQQAEAMRALNDLQFESVRKGTDKMSPAEIEREIAAARGEGAQ